jgi:Saxitoxin biosynthesis operon protein SxtJ
MKPQIHEDLTRRAGVRASSDRQFGVVIGLFLVVVSLWPLLWRGRTRTAVLMVAAAVLLTAALAPFLLHPLNRAWTMLGALLGRIVNPVAMAALFYLVFTPVGLLLRLLGKDPLRLRWDAAAPTYWIERQPPGPPPETMANQF